MVGSKQYPNLNLSSVPYISEKPTWTEVDIDHDSSTHQKSAWGQEKRWLRGTSNSHNPQLTWTSAQSEAALKVRGDASTYINHERSHHKKNPNAHKRHSSSACKHFFFPAFPHKGIHQIFLLGFIFLFFFMIHLFFPLHVCCVLSSKGGSAGLSALSSLCVCSVLKLLRVNIHLARRSEPLPSKSGRLTKSNQNSNIICRNSEMCFVMDGCCFFSEN